MSRGVNKVILVGNLGQKPDMKYTQSNTAVANLSLATSESWKDKDSGDLKTKTEWHRVVYKVYVEGKLQTRKWQDQAGNDRYTTEVLGQELTMLDSRGDSSGSSFENNNSGMSEENVNQDNGEFSEEDIPF